MPTSLNISPRTTQCWPLKLMLKKPMTLLNGMQFLRLLLKWIFISTFLIGLKFVLNHLFFSFDVNVKEGACTKPTRGIEQGDTLFPIPLHPSQILSNILNKAVNLNLMKEININDQISISHLMHVDDLLLFFYDASRKSAKKQLLL